MEVSFSHCETNGIGVLFDQSDAGVSAQHIDLHGLRSATPTDGLSFTGSGAVAYCSFRNLDLRNMPGDLVVPSNVQTSCFGPIQIGSGKIVFNGSANWAVTEGNISMGGLGFNGAVVVLSGFGDPNGSVPASIGSLYMRINGGPGTTLYVKESGPGVTGWVPK
jgi:hypothetical protein